MGITREELWRATGLKKIEPGGPGLDKWTHRAYTDLNKKIWRDNLDNAPHGHPWHTSFHGSQFPGGEKACGRAAIYGLMDIPNVGPNSPMLTATAEMGKAAENQIVYRWGQAGLLIAGKPPKKDGEEGVQFKVTDEGLWLTGAIDAVLGLPDFPYVLPVDIKSKSKEVIDQMKAGQQGYYPEHYAQVQAYIYLCDLVYDDMDWKEKGFAPPIAAIIYYVSRENPRHTFEFYVERDDEFIDRGIKNIQEWQATFKRGELPARDNNWKWTDDPCKWCRYKKMACKPDAKEKIIHAKHSNAIKFAKTLREYDHEAVSREVFDRWQKP